MMKNDKIIRTVAKNLRVIRKSKGLTQVEVAKKANITSNHYAKIERGEAEPTLTSLAALVRGLKIKSSDLLPF